MAHVGRPSNNELRKRRIQKIMKIILPVVLLLIGGVILFSHGKLVKVVDDSITKEVATNTVIKGYYCKDNTYTLSGSKCIKTLTEKSALLGDVDLNGKVTMADLTLLENYIFEEVDSKRPKLSALQLVAADIDKNKEVYVVDWQILSKYFEDDAVIGTYQKYYEKIGKEKVCRNTYKLKNNICQKQVVSKASEKNIISINITDNKNGNTSLKNNESVILNRNIKVNDTSKKYYYTWQTYSNNKVDVNNSSGCKVLSNINDNYELNMSAGNRKAKMTIYSDANCKQKLKEINTKEYKCSNCTIKEITQYHVSSPTGSFGWVKGNTQKTFYMKYSDVGQNIVQTIKWNNKNALIRKITIKVDPNSLITNKIKVSSSNSNVVIVNTDKKTKISEIVLNSKGEGSFYVIGTKIGKSTITLSPGSNKGVSTSFIVSVWEVDKKAVIWPVTPKYQLLTHDKKVYREKHYVYGTNKEWHEGLDITMPVGTNVYAMADGVVTGQNTYSGSNKDEDYGNVIFIDSKINGVTYRIAYAHLSTEPFKYVKRGTKVKQGQLIGKTGFTGGTRIPHLHIDLYNRSTGKHIDPLTILPYVDFSSLKKNITTDEFPKSSVELHTNMRKAMDNNKTWNYKIYAYTTKSVSGIPKNTKVEVVSRTKSTKTNPYLVTVKYNGKTYKNLSVFNFKFNW